MPAAAKKTPANEADVDRFVAALSDEEQRADASVLLALLRQVTKLPAKLWAPNMIGFGDAHVVNANGREVDWYFIGFAPRKGTLTLFAIGGWLVHAELLRDLGPHTLAGEGTLLHLRRLADVKLPVLKKVVQAAFEHAKESAKQAASPAQPRPKPKK